MPMTAVAIPINSFGSPLRVTQSGSGDDAARLLKRINEALYHAKDNATWQNVKDSLRDVIDECKNENWDGYEARPVSDDTIREANSFLCALPSWLTIPDIIPEPDGSIGFEWYKEKNKIFVASVNGQNVVTFAGLLGKNNKIHGTRNFDDSIPKIVIESVSEIFSSTRAS